MAPGTLAQHDAHILGGVQGAALAADAGAEHEVELPQPSWRGALVLGNLQHPGS